MLLVLSGVSAAWVTVFLLSQVVTAATTNLRVEVVFPKNNTICQPVYPFPVVFGALNFSAIRLYRPWIRWELKVVRYSSKIEPSARIQRDESGYENIDTFSNKSLIIHSSKDISNFNETVTYSLSYIWGVGPNNCLGEADFHFASGEIYFSTSKNNGLLPNIAAPGSCDTPEGTISFLGSSQGNLSCPIVSVPNTRPMECAYPLDATVRDEIAKSMEQETECWKASWPNMTGIGYRCERYGTSKSGTSTVQLGSLIWIILGFEVLFAAIL